MLAQLARSEEVDDLGLLLAVATCSKDEWTNKQVCIQLLCINKSVRLPTYADSVALPAFTRCCCCWCCFVVDGVSIKLSQSTSCQCDQLARNSRECGQRKCYTHTHTRLTAPFPGLPRWSGTRKVKPIWILLKQETVSGCGHQLGHMQVCTWLQTDNHASTPPLSCLQAGCQVRDFVPRYVLRLSTKIVGELAPGARSQPSCDQFTIMLELQST